MRAAARQHHAANGNHVHIADSLVNNLTSLSLSKPKPKPKRWARPDRNPSTLSGVPPLPAPNRALAKIDYHSGGRHRRREHGQKR
jgi:hypothetical protein